MPVLVAIVAYLLGSLSFGILYSRWRDQDVRAVDAPGGSGIYRQYGLRPALLVAVLDILKGALAVALALGLAPEWAWLAVGAVVLGHNYPVYFRFDGGAGLAPLIGALLVAAPLVLLGMLATGLLLIPAYRLLAQRTLQFNAIPVASAVAVPVGVMLAARLDSLPHLLAGGAALAVRALHLLKR